MPNTIPSQSPKPVDAVLDEMLEETFPASDPPQLDGLSENPLTLDAAELEQLIAALERHRPSLHVR